MFALRHKMKGSPASLIVKVFDFCSGCSTWRPEKGYRTKRERESLKTYYNE